MGREARDWLSGPAKYSAFHRGGWRSANLEKRVTSFLADRPIAKRAGPRGPFLFFSPAAHKSALRRWKFSPLAAWETNSPRRERVGGAAGGKTRSGRGSLIVRSPQDVAPRAPRRPFGSARCVRFVRLGGSSFVLSSFLVACSRRLFSHAHSLCVASYSATACCACCRWAGGSHVAWSSSRPFHLILYCTPPPSNTRLPTTASTSCSFGGAFLLGASALGFHWLPSWSQSLHSLMPRRVRAFFAPCSVHWNCLTISLSVWLFAVCCVSHCGTGRRGRGSVADEAGRKALESASRNTVYDSFSPTRRCPSRESSFDARVPSRERCESERRERAIVRDGRDDDARSTLTMRGGGRGARERVLASPARHVPR